MASPVDEESQVDLLLIGKTGHGKSSTANSILGREAFTVSDFADSETFWAQSGHARKFGRIIKVVDTPGLCETRLDKVEAATKIVKEMTKVIVSDCPKGFHALILVLSYGKKFTEEEQEVVLCLKAMFGGNFILDYCVVVFTQGENFDKYNEKTPEKTFSHWCMEQKGPLKELLNECKNRCVLFYNLSPEKFDSQTRQLLDLVDSLQNGGKRFTNETFQKVAKEREMMIVQQRAPKFREEFQARIDLLIDSLSNLQEKKKMDVEVFRFTGQIKKDCHSLLDEISSQDEGTGVFTSIKNKVEKLLLNVERTTDKLKHRYVKNQQLKREREERGAKKERHEQQMEDLLNVNEKLKEESEELTELIKGLDNDLKNIKAEKDADNSQKKSFFSGIIGKCVKNLAPVVLGYVFNGLVPIAKLAKYLK